MMKTLDSLSAERLRELLDYNSKTGEFTWRESRGSVKAGQRAGCLNGTGYIQIGVENVLYRAHRFAWLYVYGEWPAEGLDHRNMDKTDNRILNLRSATMSQNSANSCCHIDNKSGFKGVYLKKARKKRPWCAKIMKNGKYTHLGYFATPEEAHEAYVVAALRLFGKFARVA